MQMRRNQTEFVLLGLLSIEGNQSGYDLRKTIRGSVGYFWGESYGQIYPALRRLAIAGLIEEHRSGTKAELKPIRAAGTTRKAVKRPGRDRREYSITIDGRARLREWLAQPFRMDPPRDEFLLKLFFGREAAPSVSERHLLKFQEQNRQVLAMLEEIGRIGREKNARHPHFPYWILTLEYGIAQIRASLAWSEMALEVVRQLEVLRGLTEQNAAQERENAG